MSKFLSDPERHSGPQFEERVLWQHFKSGDYQAFKDIYCRYLDELFNYGCKVVPNRNLVKDCIQDLFIELWKNKHRLSDTDHIKYYLIKALRRRIIRDKTRGSKLVNGNPGNSYSGVNLNVEDMIIENETITDQKTRLSTALSRLPNRQKEAINLLIYQELSYDKVANVMGISLKSVYNLACKAISALRKQLKD